MRTFLFSISLLFLAALLQAQPKNIDSIESQRIAESNIKTIVQWTHRFSQGKPNPDGYKTSETHYDRRGNATEIANYRSSGSVSSRMLYKYNNDNLRTEYILYQLDENELKLAYKQTFHYNDKGLRTTEIVFDGVAAYKIMYSYDDKDRLKEIIKHASSGKQVDERWKYSYDGNNQEIKIYKPDGNLAEIHRKKFDESDNLLEDRRFDAEGNELRKITYKYNPKGWEIEKAEYFSGKLTTKLEYKHNSQGLVTEVIQHNPDGSKFTQSKYKYDEQGNLLEEQWSEDKSEDFSRRESTYDREGYVVKTDSYFAPYRYRVLYKYTYDYYK
ncbi:MAG: hypothetical protein ACLFNU_03445 [Bacteroidales bacterium]